MRQLREAEMPPSEGIEITGGRMRGAARVVRVTGRLDATAARTLDWIVDTLARRGHPLALDLSGVMYIDDAGFNELVCACVLPREDAEVRVVASSPAVHRLLERVLSGC
jgi:anti-anti-sigma factor